MSEAPQTPGQLGHHVEGHVGYVTFNNPAKFNAVNYEMWCALPTAMQALADNPQVRLIVLQGAGEKAFAAGADIKEMADKPAAEFFAQDFFSRWTSHLVKTTRKPWIAAVNGFALGGGCELAMMCDFIIAADNAKFGQPEINLGVIAGIGGTQRLSRSVGKAKAMDMNLTGRFMDAAEAERCGLVSRVVPVAKLQAEARQAAEKIAEKSQIAAIAAKDAVNRSFETTLAEGVNYERRLFQSLFATEDQKEGMSAFSEKREAQFRDR